MGSNNLIVKEYLQSLKEDQELDYLFPILLVLMGFKIKSTPKNSKGMSQYGKDIVAVGFKGEQKKRFYFELKGYNDRDIDDHTFNKKDGIRDSILAAKDTPFDDKSDSEFNKLPIEIVIVHNGIIKENFRPQYNGFITNQSLDDNFQDWDIYKLTDLFEKYLFSEYLLTDEQSLRHFKRTLVLLDAPENDFSDFRALINLQLEGIIKIKGRSLKKFFATLNLLSVIIFHYSRENNNLHPAKECLTYLTLKIWAWILKNNLESKPAIIKEFRKLLNIHFDVLNEFFAKTLPIARSKNGLFSEQGRNFEAIGYPLRCFDYLNYLIYYLKASKYLLSNLDDSKASHNDVFESDKIILTDIILNNDGCSRPLIDNHSISITNVIQYFLQNPKLNQSDINFIGDYIVRILDNIHLIKLTRDRYPELHNSITALTEYSSTNVRPYNYEDRSSLLITFLFEFTTLIKAPDIYNEFQKEFKNKIDLQTAYPNYKEFDIEQLLFEKNFDEEFYVESSIDLKDNFEEFEKTIKDKEVEKINYRTDKAGFSFLRTLAHIYFKNEIFVDEWRKPQPESN